MIHSRQFEVEELSINELEVSKTNPRFIQTVLKLLVSFIIFFVSRLISSAIANSSC